MKLLILFSRKTKTTNKNNNRKRAAINKLNALFTNTELFAKEKKNEEEEEIRNERSNQST
jgi:hypothetical protein